MNTRSNAAARGLEVRRDALRDADARRRPPPRASQRASALRRQISAAGFALLDEHDLGGAAHTASRPSAPEPA